MPKKLLSRVAVVTGAGRGLGRAMAIALAQEGAIVVVNDTGVEMDGTGGSRAPADQVVAEIRASGGAAIPNYDSVSTFLSAGRVIEAATRSFGKIDILINNAGILRGGPIWQMTPESFESVLSAHLKGTFYCTRHACESMREQQWGRIINIVSRAGLVGSANTADYAAAKGGIFGFTNAVSRDLAPFGITVNAINPGAALTRMVTSAVERAKREGEDPGRAQRMLSIAQQPEDLAPLAAYLSTNEASGITGQIFFVLRGQVGLFPPMTISKEVSKSGRWTVDELAKAIPKLEIPPLQQLY